MSRVKGKMLPGASRTLEFEKEFIGKFKDGWKVSSDNYDKTPGGMQSTTSQLILTYK